MPGYPICILLLQCANNIMFFMESAVEETMNRSTL